MLKELRGFRHEQFEYVHNFEITVAPKDPLVSQLFNWAWRLRLFSRQNGFEKSELKSKHLIS